MAETEDRLLLLVSDLIAQRKAQGQSLSYNTIKRKILENFSESFFAAHKRKVQNLLEAAERGGNVAPRPSTGNTAESEEILQFEETESNLFQVVNDFIALKKSKNQNISYPTIKRHILKHFSPQFFEKHKSTVQQRLENAFRRDPSNGQFIEDIERQQAPGAVRARTLESIFANMEVVLADMKIRHPYPVSDQYDEVIEQVIVLHCLLRVESVIRMRHMSLEEYERMWCLACVVGFSREKHPFILRAYEVFA